eukprot:5256955-Prymnesium_polylepis.1
MQGSPWTVASSDAGARTVASSEAAAGTPSHDTSLRSARNAALLAQEDARGKAQQIELMTALLKAAEDELQLRSNQLSITTDTLRATEAELSRKDAQLQVLTSRLHAAEQSREHVDWPALLDEQSAGNARLFGQSGDTCQAGAPIRNLRQPLAEQSLQYRNRRVPPAAPSSPAGLPEQQQRAQLEAGTALLAPTRVHLMYYGTDAEETMRPKVPVLDARSSVVEYVQCRAENGRLPLTRTGLLSWPFGDRE